MFSLYRFVDSREFVFLVAFLSSMGVGVSAFTRCGGGARSFPERHTDGVGAGRLLCIAEHLSCGGI